MDPRTMAIQMMDEDMPSLCLTTDELPEIKDWKTGGKYTLQVDVIMEETELQEDDSINAQFTVDKVKVLK